MNNIKIIAKTEAGITAIKQHIKESHKLKFHVKLMWKRMGYYQELISEDPYTLKIGLKNKRIAVMVKDKHFCMEIEEALKENGATVDIDYILVVE